MSEPAVATVSLEADWDTFCAIETEIGDAESTGIEARWRCGRVLLRYDKRPGSKDSPLTDAVRRLSSEFGISEPELYNRRQFCEENPDEEDLSRILESFRSWEQVVRDLGERAAGTAHVSHNSGDNEWYTPADYIEAARRVMGVIDLDPASTQTANEVVGATTFFSEEDDGLAHGWSGTVWMNPPYARPFIDQFCAKLADSFRSGSVTEACVLVNNATETAWFHEVGLAASAACFPKGRVKFWHPDKESATPLQGQAVLYLGSRLERFAAEFGSLGLIVSVP